MKLSDRILNAMRYPIDVVATRIGLAHPSKCERLKVCHNCEMKQEDPLYKDEQMRTMLGLEEFMCGECGCPLDKLCRSFQKRCPKGKW